MGLSDVEESPEDFASTGGSGRRRKSSKILALADAFSAKPKSDYARASARGGNRSNSGATSKEGPKDGSKEDVPTVLLVSDDPRLAPFGPVIEYNGRDAFELGAVGSVVALLDATPGGRPGGEGDDDEGFFVFNLANNYP